MVQQNVQQ